MISKKIGSKYLYRRKRKVKIYKTSNNLHLNKLESYFRKIISLTLKLSNFLPKKGLRINYFLISIDSVLW